MTTHMDYANAGSVQIGGQYKIAGPAKDTPSRRAIFVCQPHRFERASLRQHDPFANGAAILSPARYESRRPDPDGVFQHWPARWRKL
jgi:hypothetical protein